MHHDGGVTRSHMPEARTVVRAILLVTLMGSIVFASVRLATAPAASADPSVRVQSDYVLMLLQCALGIVVMFLPLIVQRRFAVHLPSAIEIAFFVFLYCAIYLGEVRSFYFRIPYWDNVLHFFSGAMLGALGFVLVQLLNDSQRLHVELSPAFVSFFAFCFALASGVVWEIYEFAADSLLGTNMQKYVTEAGEVLIGRSALHDTMIDLIIDASAALIVTVLGFLWLRPRMGKDAERPAPLLERRPAAD